MGFIRQPEFEQHASVEPIGMATAAYDRQLAVHRLVIEATVALGIAELPGPSPETRVPILSIPHLVLAAWYCWQGMPTSTATITKGGFPNIGSFVWARSCGRGVAI
eukprot:8252972-Alexandrium_andersonii.AAC.1